MLSVLLQEGIANLDTLIHSTNKDIVDIKSANHDAIFNRIKDKESAIAEFEKNRALVAECISELVKQNPDKELSSILSDDENEHFDTLRQRLSTLKDINHRFARMVISVKGFYASLLEKMMPTKMEGYSKVVDNNLFLEANIRA